MMNKYHSVISRLFQRSSSFSEQEVSTKKCKKRTSSSISTFVIFLFSFAFVQAQSISNYVFTNGTNGTLVDLSTGSTAYLNGNLDDAAGTVQAIGFNFTFMGTTYSHFSANSNGQMRLHASVAEAAIGTNVTTALNAAILAPFTGDNEVGNGLRFRVTGIAPNRVFVLEWNQFYVNFANLSNAGNMQVLLNETTGIITYIYGTIYNSSTLAQTRSISLASSNTATTVGSITIGATPTFTAGTTLVANTIAAGAAPVGITPIANIGSLTDGNRVFFTFTPNTTVSGDVTNLTFTAVTANTTTLNWDDFATNEVGFRVTRATDAGFTQNVSNVIVASTTSAGTGTSYTSNQTGLSAGTTYFYRIVAIVEAGQSVGISGNQITLSGATYYWLGSTGGSWNNFNNWNAAPDGSGLTPSAWATSDVHVIDGEGIVPGGVLAISVDRPSFTVGQILITSNTNVTLSSDATTTRTITISGGPSADFILENGSTLNLTNATNAVAFAFTGIGNVGTLAGTYFAAGSTSNTINTTGGTGTLFSVTPTGIVNNSIIGSSGCILSSIATLSFANGSNYTHSSFTTSNAYVPLATWGASSNVFITGGTTSTALTNAAQSFGNFTYNSALSTAVFSAFTTSLIATIQGNLTILNTNTGTFRATTSGTLTVNGNVIITSGRFQAASTTGTVIANGTTTIGTAGILELTATGAGTYSQRGTTFTNNGVLTGTFGNLQFLNFTGSFPQTLDGSGTVLTNIATLSVQNAAGVTLSNVNPLIIARANLFQGTVNNSNNITFGTGLAVNCITQIGAAGLTTPGGSFGAMPIFNLGTGTYAVNYAQESVARTTGFEIPTTRIVNSITVNNTNGLTIAGGNLTAISTLALTAGIVTTGANEFVLGNTTTVGTLTGGSATEYVNGSLTRSIATANTNATFVTYPIGKAGVYTPLALAPTTTSIAQFKAESFDVNAGTADPSIIGLSATRRFEALPVSGSFTDINVRLSDANIVSTNIPVQAPTAAGAYSAAFGSTAAFVAGPPITITSDFPVTSANYTGFLSFANSNACSGTPAPGATITSANGLCSGASATLGITTIPAGSGVTYQWQSSTDGVTYTNISGATGSSFLTTPTAQLFYLCNVTCSVGPATGSSTPIQLTFANSVTATTPGTRCGTGTVTLAATPSAGATINWFAAATGGNTIGSGSSFTTPSISASTDYFASAATFAPGSIGLGAGAITSTSVGGTFFPGGWGGAKTQYIIRASELADAGIGAGNITSLGFEPTTAGQTYQGFVVEIGATGQNVAGTTFISGLTQVYRGTLADDGYLPVANTVNTLAFGTGAGTTSSFNWDGTSNVVVSISWSRVPAANTATVSGMKVDNVGFNSTASRQRDNLTPAAMLADTLPNTFNTATNRPRFIINGSVLCFSPRVPVTATVTAPPALTLSATATSICSGDVSTAITATAGASDYDTYVWTPSTGVTGNAIAGWVFNPTMTTAYSLIASQSTGTLCSTIGAVMVTVNPLPSAMTISPASPAVCIDVIQPMATVGGTLDNLPILSENFNGATNNWTRVNNTTGGTDVTIPAWTLRPSGFVQGATFVTQDASQFYLSNSDAGGSGNVTNVSLISPSFSTVGFTVANVSFAHFYQHWASGNGIATVAYSVDNGTTWLPVQSYTATVGTANAFANATLALPAGALNQSNVQIRFNHSVIWGFYWAIDNVSIAGTQAQATTWSPITNLFSDAAATVPYVANASATTVYFKSSTVAAATTYTATSTSTSGCFRTATTSVTVNGPTTSTTTLTNCGPLVWNGISRPTSGTYTFISPNSIGCDSIATLNLTVIPLSTSSITATACASYTSPSGVVYTTSGTYSDTLQSSTGCPVILSIALTINNATASTISPVVCGTYTAPNGTVYTSSGTYTASLTGANGCDSIVTINLTVNQTTTTSISPVACGTYTSPSGTVYTASANFNDTLTSVSGCDSIVQVNLTINNPTSSTLTVASCGTYTSPTGLVYSTSGVYADTIPNALGCDSVITINLTVNSPSTSSITATSCGDYTSPSGAIYSASGTYTDIIQNAAGCDSVITIVLTLTPALDMSVTLNANILVSNEVGATYQWIDCANGNAPIAGATNQSFLAMENGSYAVIVSNGSCPTDTSVCVLVTSVGLEDLKSLLKIVIYPNPTNGIIQLSHAGYDEMTMEVMDASGRIVINPTSVEAKQIIDLTNFNRGVYFVKLETANGVHVERIIKN